MGIGIAFDQPAAGQHFDAELVARLQRLRGDCQPGLAMRRLARVAQRAARGAAPRPRPQRA